MDLPAKRLGSQVLAGEDGSDRAAQFLQRRVGGVLGASAGEAPEDLLGLGGTEPEGRGTMEADLTNTTKEVLRAFPTAACDRRERR